MKNFFVFFFLKITCSSTLSPNVLHGMMQTFLLLMNYAELRNINSFLEKYDEKNISKNSIF